MAINLSQAVPVETDSQGTDYIPNQKIDLSMATPVPDSQKGQTDFEKIMGNDPVETGIFPHEKNISTPSISKEDLAKQAESPQPKDPFNQIVHLIGDKIYDTYGKSFNLGGGETSQLETEDEKNNPAGDMGKFNVAGVDIKPVDMVAGAIPYLLAGPIITGGLLANMGVFGALSINEEIGSQKSESLMIPNDVKEKQLVEAGAMGATMGGMWSVLPKFAPFKNVVANTLARAGLAGTSIGVASAGLHAIYGEDLKAAYEDGGQMFMASLLWEVPGLGKSLLGRGGIEMINKWGSTLFPSSIQPEANKPILVNEMTGEQKGKYPATTEPEKPGETKPAKAFVPIDPDRDSEKIIKDKIAMVMDKMADKNGITDKPKIVGAAVKLRDEGTERSKEEYGQTLTLRGSKGSYLLGDFAIKKEGNSWTMERGTQGSPDFVSMIAQSKNEAVQIIRDGIESGEIKVPNIPKESKYIDASNHEDALKKAGLSKDTAVEGKDYDAYLKDNHGKYYTRDEAKDKFGIYHSGQIPPADLEENTKALGDPKPLKITNPDTLKAIEALGDEAGKMDLRLIPGWSEIASALEESNKAYMENLEALNINKIAHMTAADLRERLGRIAINMDRLEASLAAAKKMFAKASKASIIDTFTRAERGEAQDTPELQQIYDTLQSIFQYQRGRLESLGHGAMENFIENYLPHIWVKPGMAGKIYGKIMGKRPFEGPASFKKHRTIMDFSEGIKQGLEPVSWNPVDITMLKAREMERYIAAHGALAANKELGFIKFIRTEKPQEKPNGWVKINDKMSDVYSKNKAGELVRRGTYYAQPDCARIFNNYLSPGLRGNWLYDTYRGAGNGLVQFRLSLSAFHLGFTSLDATISKNALGINKMAAGDIAGAAKEFATAPLAPITNALQGKKLIDAWHGKMPGTIYETYAQLYALGGGRSGMDDFYATGFKERVDKAIKEGKWLSAALNYPGMALQKISTPIMKYIVPWQKAGVFMDLMRWECEKNPNMSHVELRDKAQKIVDSVDNRLGQLTYDNLFIDKTLKDLGMASVQSLGWNIGTVREVGGGVSDLGRQSVRALKGKKAEFTYRMAYIMAMPAVVGLYSAIYQTLHTGIWPQEMKDYFYPKNGGVDKNGQPQRVNLPSYAKDIYHFTEDPFKTVTNKLNPIWSMMIEFKDNKDFFGNQIINEDDNDVQKAAQALKFILGGYEPYSFSNMMKQTAGPKWESFVGVTPAPYDINMNDLERRLYKLASEKHMEEARTSEVAEHSKTKSDIRSEYFKNKDSLVLSDAVDAGKISQQEANQIEKESTMSNVERLGKKLTPEELMRIEKRKGFLGGIQRTPDEEQELQDLVTQKRDSKEKEGTWTDKSEEMYQEMLAGT